MKGKKIFRKIIVSVLILTMVLSNVTVAADNRQDVQEQTGEIPTDGGSGDGQEAVTAQPAPAAPPADSQPSTGLESAGGQVQQDPETGDPSVEDPKPVEEQDSEEDQNSEEEQNPTEDQDPAGDQTPDAPAPEDPSGEQPPEEAGNLDDQPLEDQDSLPEEPADEADEPEESDEFEDLMSLEELTALPDDVAKSTMWRDRPVRRMARAAFFSLDAVDSDQGTPGGDQNTPETQKNTWSFNSYYVNQSDPNEVRKTTDFNLKYQMEFHTEEDIAIGDVEIRIPWQLFRRRGIGEAFSKPEGEPVVPKDDTHIGVPVVKDKTEKKDSKTTSFNCYIDKETNELVFFNYKSISAGTNAAWQVLYKDIKIMEVVDNTSWMLTAVPKVMQLRQKPDGEGNQVTEKYETTQDVNPLTGSVDSTVRLTHVEKTVHTKLDQAYAPGLYTRTQVEAYIGQPLISDYADHMSDWKFVVWDVKIAGEATQPWTLQLQEQPVAHIKRENADGTVTTEEIPGKVVGYRNNTMPGTSYALNITNNVSFAETAENSGIHTADVKEKCQESVWGSRFYIVTAYPAEKIQEGDQLENNLKVCLIPADSPVTETDSREDRASWEYENYNWSYSGNVIITDKISNPSGGNETEQDLKTYNSWLEIYRKYQETSKAGQDYGGIYFSSTGDIRGYGYTHTAPETEEDGTVVNNDGTIGEYKEGTYYQMIASDDLIYAYSYKKNSGGTAEPQGKPIRLTGADYYFDNITITQTDTGYDVSDQMETSKPDVKGGITEKMPNISSDLIIEAVYDPRNENAWVKAVTVSWDSSGRMVYTGNLENDKGEKPYRVRAVHNTLEYRSRCQIEVNVCLRAGSPVMKELIEKYKTDPGFYVTLKNFSAVIGEAYRQEGEQAVKTVIGLGKDTEDYTKNYLASDRADLNLVATAEQLYEAFYGQTDVLPVLDDADAALYGLQKEARAYKEAEYTNDPDHSRVLVNYRLTAYDGYVVPDQTAADALESTGLPSPGKKYVMFYDLLPKGVHFDPSVPLYAGRITELDARQDFKKRLDKWDPDGVQVSMDMKKDFVENWNQTGRTMVIFHIAYDSKQNPDPAVYTNGRWMEGWGVSFGAYYEWKDAKGVLSRHNISAFMPDAARYKSLLDKLTGSFQPPELIGSPEEVYVDNGSIIGTGPSLYQDFYRDQKPLNSENAGKNVRNVLYASHQIRTDDVQNSTSGLAMYVRADEDAPGVYGESTYVGAGMGYAYEVDVTAPGGGLKDIVVFDHLENAAEERKGINDPNKENFGQGSWQGSLRSVDCSDLEEEGIVPVIWYSADRFAPTTHWAKTDGEQPGLTGREQDIAPSEVLTGTNNWYQADVYIQNYVTDHNNDPEYKNLEPGAKEAALREAALASVGSVAVELHRCKVEQDGKTVEQDFVLQAGNTLSFKIRMQAPEWKDSLAGKSAFNNPSYYSNPFVGENTNPLPVANSVRVGIGTSSTLEVVKKLENAENTPKSYKDASFEFRLYRKGSVTESDGTVKETENAVSGKSYTLQEWDESSGTYQKIEETIPHGTDAYGRFYLKRGQKAVFENMAVTDVNSVLLEETPDIHWSVSRDSKTESDTNGQITHTYEVVNRYQPVLFVQKTTVGTPEGLTAEEQKKLAETDFTFQLSLNSEKSAVEYCYVDRVALNGGSAKIVEGSKAPDDNGKYYTGANGDFTIRAGEIIALFLPKADMAYELKELGASVTEETMDSEGNPKTEVKPSLDWIIDSSKNAASGQVPIGGAKAEVKNYYRWRQLRLTKRITSQEASECQEFFTFEIRDAEEKLVTGKNWYLEKPDGTPVYEETSEPEGAERKQIGGVIEDGKICCACAGRVIRIEGLEAGVTYRIKEVGVPALYVPLENEKDVWMPMESYTQTETFVNDYQKRPLYVTKTLVSDTQDDKAFQMIIGKKGENGTYTYGEFSYQVDGGAPQTTANGMFELQNGQTAEFPEIGVVGDEFIVWEVADETYPQLSPILKDGESLEGVNRPGGYTLRTGEYAPNQVGAPGRAVLGTDSTVKFINGQPGMLMLSKEYAGAAGSTDAQTQKNQNIAEAIKEQVGMREAVTDKIDKINETMYLESELNVLGDRNGIIYHMKEMSEQASNGFNAPQDRLSILNEFVTHRNEILRVLDNLKAKIRNESYRGRIESIESLCRELCPEKAPEINWDDPENPPQDEEWMGVAWWTERIDKVQGLLHAVEEVREFLGNSQNALEVEISNLEEDYNTDVFNVMVHLTVDGQDWNPRQTDEIICIDQLGGQVYRIFYHPGQEEDFEQGIWQIDPHWSMICLSGNGPDSSGGVEVKEGDEIFNWTDDGDFMIRPHMLYVIPLPSEESEYTVTETDCNSGDVPYLEGFGKAYMIEQETPKVGESLQNNVKEEPRVVIRNEVRAYEGSLIEKRMTSASEPVPVTAKLVWRVERYSAGRWNPAGGIEYVVQEGRMEDGSLRIDTSSRTTEKTGARGEILLRRSRSDNTYLAVQFLKDKVYLNVDEEDLQNLSGGKNGMLRVVEVPEKTDIAYWGVLAGYGTAGSKAEYGDVPYTLATAFVNSNRLVPVEIEKYVEDGEGKEFTMVLEQRQKDLLTNGDVYRLCADIPYELYEKATGVLVPKDSNTDRHATDEHGRIILRDGQYAKLWLSTEAVWSVREDLTDRPDYTLASVASVNDMKGLLSSGGTTDRMFINLKEVQFPEAGSDYTLTAYDVQCGVVSSTDGSLITLREGDVTIPEYIQKDGVRRKVTGIASEAFARCNDLTSVAVPTSITTIGPSAFKDCGSLMTVTVSDSVTKIEDGTFAGCGKLTGVTLPGTLQSIGQSAFKGCSSLGSLTIPNNVTSIGEYAFSRSGLTSVIVPEKVTSLGAGAFDLCQKLATAEIKGNLDFVAGTDGRYDLYEETEPWGLIEHVEYSGIFRRCSGLHTLTISGHVGELNGFGYLTCPNLKNVYIPGTVDRIGPYAFQGSLSLETITMTGTVGVVGDNAFSACRNLTNVTLSSALQKIESGAFGGCRKMVTVSLPNGLQIIGNGAFFECTSLKEIVIPESVTELGDGAFSGCTALREARILNTEIKFIRFRTFSGCTAFSDIYIHSKSAHIQWEWNPEIENSSALPLYNHITFHVGWGQDEHPWNWGKSDSYPGRLWGVYRWKIVYSDGTEVSSETTP